MSKPITFTLLDEETHMQFGKIVFNGKFVFELDPKITTGVWQQVGFIPLKDNQRSVESDDLFYYLNSRLPIALRDESQKKKLDYITENGLRVASDSFALTPV